MKRPSLKIILSASAIFFSALLLTCGIFGAVRHSGLIALRDGMLSYLSENPDGFDPHSVVLADTSPERASRIADMLGASLRINSRGDYAALTLPDGVTVADVISDGRNLGILREISVDRCVKTSDISVAEHTPSRPDFEVDDYAYASQTYLDYINIGSTWRTTLGKGVTVAVIDSGIDTDNKEFAGRISEYSYNASRDMIVRDYVKSDGTYDFSLVEDTQGHGTAVSGIIAAAKNGKGTVGIAPEATILAIKVECKDNGTFERASDLMFGLYYAIECGADVVNMSFGGDVDMTDAITLAEDSDVICVAAAGNEGTADACYPAANEYVIGVGALEKRSYILADYSNYGVNCDITAPGETFTTYKNARYATVEGTSMASPIVAGIAALYKAENPDCTAKGFRDILYASAYDLGEAGHDTFYGYGAVDAASLVIGKKGTVTFDMRTDTLRGITMEFVCGNVMQNVPEPKRDGAVFDGWYYDTGYTRRLDGYNDTFADGTTLYARWITDADEIPYSYTVTDDGVRIDGYIGMADRVTVPDRLGGLPVTVIGDGAFAGCDKIRRVTLPDTVTSVGERAFAGCTSLESITFPDSVTEIGESAFEDAGNLSYVGFGTDSKLRSVGKYAFAGCVKLREFTVPDMLAVLDASAFSGCTAMEKYSVSGQNRVFAVSDGVLFSRGSGGTTLVAFPAGRTGEYSVPDDTAAVGDYAFAYASVTSVALGKVVSVGTDAFAYSHLTRISIPSSVRTVGDFAFEYCTELENAAVSEAMTEIPRGMFLGDTAIESVVIPDQVKTVGDYAFADVGMTSLTFESVSRTESIGIGAFMNHKIETLDLPAQLRMIAEAAFFTDEYNYTLKTLTFGTNSQLKSIGEAAFANHMELRSVTLPERLETLGDYAFADGGLSGTVKVPRSVEEIRPGVFASCHSLSAIEVDPTDPIYLDMDGVVYTKMDQTLVAYPAGKAQTEFDIPDDIETVYDSAFYGAWNLETVTFPESLTEIQTSAFFDCQSLTSVTFPDKLKLIGNSAFATDKSLSSVVFGNDPSLSRIGFEAFADCGIASVNVPSSVSSMAQGVFRGCESLAAVTFGAGSRLGTLAAYTFDGCTALRSVTFGSGTALSSVQPHALDGIPNTARLDFADAVLDIAQCDHKKAVEIEESSPTCTKAGNKAYFYCFVCGKYFADPDCTKLITEDIAEWRTISATGHTVVTDPAVEPTCTVHGRTKGEYCLVCGEIFTMQEKLPPLGHEYRDGVCVRCGEGKITVKGDADGDGIFGARDASATAKYLAGWNTAIDMECADVNGDGEVNGKDLALMMKRLAGWEVSFAEAIKADTGVFVRS